MLSMDYNTIPWQVELITYVGGLPKFLRNALIFVGYGEYLDAQYKTKLTFNYQLLSIFVYILL